MSTRIETELPFLGLQQGETSTPRVHVHVHML